MKTQDEQGPGYGPLSDLVGIMFWGLCFAAYFGWPFILIGLGVLIGMALTAMNA